MDLLRRGSWLAASRAAGIELWYAGVCNSQVGWWSRKSRYEVCLTSRCLAHARSDVDDRLFRSTPNSIHRRPNSVKSELSEIRNIRIHQIRRYYLQVSSTMSLEDLFMTRTISRCEQILSSSLCRGSSLIVRPFRKVLFSLKASTHTSLDPFLTNLRTFARSTPNWEPQLLSITHTSVSAS